MAWCGNNDKQDETEIDGEVKQKLNQFLTRDILMLF